MERKNLEAGKKAAEHLAPDPAGHVPEAPIISEEEAQIVESPDNDTSANAANRAGTSGGNIVDKTPDDDRTVPEDGSVRARPKSDSSST